MQVHDPGAGSNTPPGWYADPWRAAPYRWWDGFAWTGQIRGDTQAQWATQPAMQPVPYYSSTEPRARDDLTGGGVAVLGFFGAFALALIFSVVAVGAGFAKDSVTVDVISHVGLWGGLFMAAYIVSRRRRPGGTLRDLGFYRPIGSEIGLGIGFAFMALFVESRVVQLLNALLPPDNRGISSNVFVQHQPSAAAIFVTALLVCVGAPIFEELFFRGVVQGILTHRLGPIPAIGIQALLFGSAHYQFGMTANQAIVRIAAITTVGLFLGALRHRTGRLGAGICAHATNNVIVVVVTIALLNR